MLHGIKASTKNDDEKSSHGEYDFVSVGYNVFCSSRFEDLRYNMNESGKCHIYNFSQYGIGSDNIIKASERIQSVKPKYGYIFELPVPENCSNNFYRVHPENAQHVFHVNESLKRLVYGFNFDDYVCTQRLVYELSISAPKQFPILKHDIMHSWSKNLSHILELFSEQNVYFLLSPQRPLLHLISKALELTDEVAIKNLHRNIDPQWISLGENPDYSDRLSSILTKIMAQGDPQATRT